MRRLILLAALFGVAITPGDAATTRRRPSLEQRQMAAVVASFDGIALADAAIEQPDRVAAAIAALPPHGPAPERPVLAIGGSGWQAIFDREARRAVAVLASRGAGPALVLSNTAVQARSGVLASRRTVALAIAGIGRRARPDDIAIVYLASHGGEDANIQMDAPGLDFADLTAADLAAALDGAGLRRRIVIVSACFGASWIPALASPTTIVITAAAADRTSFGCDDSRELTLFGETLLGELAKPQPLASAFAAAKAGISAAERRMKITPSLPQVSVGAAMQGVWAGDR
jgi:hypothetical protein